MNNEDKRKKRGQITTNDLKPYEDSSSSKLIKMLYSDNPQKRTIAATILGNNKDILSINDLGIVFKTEKALYSRIAISETLGNMGEESLPFLLDLLGKIGNNQEKKLSTKYFNKKSYPLVRDIVGRTIVKIGNISLSYLISFMKNPNIDLFYKQHVIDTIGAITSKTDNFIALSVLINYFNLSNKNNDKFTVWKIIRSFSAFHGSKEVNLLLTKIINDYNDPPLIWESIRSLGQIRVTNKDTLKILDDYQENDSSEIRKAVDNAHTLLFY